MPSINSCISNFMVSKPLRRTEVRDMSLNSVIIYATIYMNAEAIHVWEEMGREPKIIGEQVRPPRTALLAFAVPFSK
jgi:hypothetical protein